MSCADSQQPIHSEISASRVDRPSCPPRCKVCRASLDAVRTALARPANAAAPPSPPQHPEGQAPMRGANPCRTSCCCPACDPNSFGLVQIKSRDQYHACRAKKDQLQDRSAATSLKCSLQHALATAAAAFSVVYYKRSSQRVANGPPCHTKRHTYHHCDHTNIIALSSSLLRHHVMCKQPATHSQ